MSAGWNWYVAIITILTIAGCFWIINWTTKKRPGETKVGETTGHKWDDDLEEYNNPLPRWWLWLFYLTIIFSLVYFVLYPGIGVYQGSLGWTQKGQYDAEKDAVADKYAAIFANYARMDIDSLIKNDKAMASGRRLFLNHCATCHGSDAGGAPGFPSLADNAWIFGGSFDDIKLSIIEGRPNLNKGNMNGMPPFGAAVGGEDGAENVAHYVLSLSGAEHDASKAAAGKASFAVCMGCHGAEGKGNPQMGAPNLTDNAWIYGGNVDAIKETILKGRNGIMPAHKDILSEEKSHLIAAYVYSLSK